MGTLMPHRCSRTRGMLWPTVGVEEEYFLARPGSRTLAPGGTRVVKRAAAALGPLVDGEFTECQVEVRAMDVPATAADTAVLAAIVRALVVVALMSVRAGAPDRRSAASCRARPTGVRRGTDGAVTAWTS
ncbi:hypothetical protein [Streptomyces abikoensis]|uniref:Uncharacterized protein n=1 Tax=Streptomyces abikoensis TaxID=97398 RepID=A0ABW7SVZ1_9ACTN